METEYEFRNGNRIRVSYDTEIRIDDYCFWKNGKRYSVREALIEFKTNGDPMAEVTGRAEDSNPKEIAQFKARLKELGVELEISNEIERISYQPSPVRGKPGRMVVFIDSSYSAWCHEMQHMEDDYQCGWQGVYEAAQPRKHYAWEKRAYGREIKLAKKAGRKDIVKRLRQNRNFERWRLFNELYTIGDGNQENGK